MVGVIIVIMGFDAPATARAAARVIIGPIRAKARIIAATYSALDVTDATASPNRRRAREMKNARESLVDH